MGFAWVLSSSPSPEKPFLINDISEISATENAYPSLPEKVLVSKSIISPADCEECNLVRSQWFSRVRTVQCTRENVDFLKYFSFMNPLRSIKFIWGTGIIPLAMVVQSIRLRSLSKNFSLKFQKNRQTLWKNLQFEEASRLSYFNCYTISSFPIPTYWV